MDLQNLYDHAIAAHHRGKLSEAELPICNYLRPSPAIARRAYSLGILRAQQGRLQEAVDLIGSALIALPSSPEMLWSYGDMLLKVGRHADALACFDRGLSYEPGNPTSYWEGATHCRACNATKRRWKAMIALWRSGLRTRSRSPIVAIPL